jgi:hypothetical protein
MRRSILVPTLVAAILAVGCGDGTRLVAPPGTEPLQAAARFAELASTSDPAAAIGELPALDGARVAAVDALDRVVPTLAEGDARTTLSGALVRLDAALGLGDLAAAADALSGAREALAAIATAGSSAPADLGVVELALDRTDALLASPPLAGVLP